jgi:hypothetical protein
MREDGKKNENEREIIGPINQLLTSKTIRLAQLVNKFPPCKNTCSYVSTNAEVTFSIMLQFYD